MARTTITVQRLANKAGQSITFQPIDSLNGMQFRNTGVEVVLVQTGTGASVALTVPSVADPYGRTGDAGGSTGASLTKGFGPFTPPTIWGDGASVAHLDFGTVTGGTANVAVIAI